MRLLRRIVCSGNIRLAVGIATAISAFILITDLLLLPAYAHGHAQGLLGIFNAASMLISLPGLLVAIETGVRAGRHTSPGAWWFILVVNFLLWMAAVALVVWLGQFLAARLRRPPAAGAEDRHAPVPNLTRRRLLIGGAGLLAAGSFGYFAAIAPRDFRITHRVIGIKGLAPELSGLRIVQITDVHHGP